MYNVILKPSAAKNFHNLPVKTKQKIAAKIDLLAITPLPSGVKKLSGHSDIWRLRFGDYRLVYQLAHSTSVLTILKIAHRSVAYERIQ